MLIKIGVQGTVPTRKVSVDSTIDKESGREIIPTQVKEILGDADTTNGERVGKVRLLHNVGGLAGVRLGEVEQIGEAQQAHGAEVGHGVGALEADSLPVLAVPAPPPRLAGQQQVPQLGQHGLVPRVRPPVRRPRQPAQRALHRLQALQSRQPQANAI